MMYGEVFQGQGATKIVWYPHAHPNFLAPLQLDAATWLVLANGL